MKKLLIVIRWIVGLLFIFSGLIKANDPSGLSYKMQEFFEVWGWNNLNDYALAFAIMMNILEVTAGISVIIGRRMKLFGWILLILIIFFSFLTGYALFSGKIKTCGCFGDCLPLTPLQSFIKDIVLLVLIFLLFIKRKVIFPFVKPLLSDIIIIIGISGTIFLQAYVLRHLPIADCLPYKEGNSIIEKMKLPPDALQDSFAITFKYKKNGKTVEFDANSFPPDFDSTYEYLDRYDKLIKKGNATVAISDFSLETLHGNDTTLAILNQPYYYVMLMAKDFSNAQKWNTREFKELHKTMLQSHIPLFIVTADKEKAVELFGADKRITILVCDGTVIKTAARINPTYIIMKQGSIKAKYSYADIDKISRFLFQ